MKYAIAALAIVILSSGGAMAADCAKLMQAYEHQGKVMSLEQAERVGDDSVHRAIYKTMKVIHLQLSRQMNLTLMVQNKCPLPNDPVWLMITRLTP